MKKLTGNQSKLDLNKNGKLDSNDFKMLRKKKGNGGGTGVSSETGFAEGTNADLIMNQDYLAYAKGGGVGLKIGDSYKIEGSHPNVYNGGIEYIEGQIMPVVRQLLVEYYSQCETLYDQARHDIMTV